MRAGVLKGVSSTIDTQDHIVAFAGPFSGDGGLVKKGDGTLILKGVNSYLGDTSINAGTLEGNTNSLQGDIVIHGGATVAFHQNFSGIYEGSLKGNGSFVKTEDGLLEIVGNHSGFQGTTVVTKGELKVNGSSPILP